MRKIIILSFGIIISGFLFYNGAFADNVDYTVNVAPSLNVSVSSNNVVLDLNPNSKTLDSKDITVTVGTNNITGYKLNMSTTGDITSLTRDSSLDGINDTIPTLSNEAGATASTLSDNTWGYRLNNTGNFIPYVSGTLIMEKNIATNADTATLSFASKINYSQAAGSYTINLNFTGVTNPLIDYMQDFTKAMCEEKASDADYIVVDKRDDNEYTVHYINGNCWMTQDLRFVGMSSDSAGIMTLDSTTSNISPTYTPTSPLVVSYTNSGTNCSPAWIYTGDGYDGVFTAWYNYAAVSGGSTCGTDIVYDICPAGWRLPNYTEQNGLVSTIGGSPSVLNPLPNGLRDRGQYNWNGTYGYEWSSSISNRSGRHWNLYYSKTQNMLEMYDGMNYYGMNVRCIAKY
ncbi:hypothetical protein IJI86_02905 [Candidatus Saccharibacteria bacterium]|nr:hypothetical protein [Candidatus Saccharibacteria bacterium]